MADRGYRPTCAMEPCTLQGVRKIKAFGNPEPRWWCADHAELAEVNAAAHGQEDETNE